MSRPHRVRGRLEALVLLVVGLGSLAFALGDDYTVLMNPSFRWVTVGGAALVALLGLALLSHPRREQGVSALLTFLLLLLLVGIARPVGKGRSVLAREVPPPVTLAREGYARLDGREIFVGFRTEADDLGERRVVMGGLVKRLPALDPGGRYVLLDPVMACCLADAVAFGVVVDAGPASLPPDGEWLYVYGTIRDDPATVDTPPVRTGNIVFTALSTRYRLEADDVVTYRALLEDVVAKIPAERCALFRQSLEETGLADRLRGEGPFTIFVPLDLSFEAASRDPQRLRSYLEGFVVRGRVSKRDLFAVETLESLSGRVLHVRAVNGRLEVEGARVLFGDSMARNGILHLVHPAWKDR